MLLDLLEVVADEDAPRVFDVAGRLVESGHDLRHVCRELARLVRDLMVLQVDPERTRIRSSRSKATATGCARSPRASRARICCAPSS